MKTVLKFLLLSVVIVVLSACGGKSSNTSDDTVPVLADFNSSINEDKSIGSVVGDLNIVSIGSSNISSFTLSNTDDFSISNTGRITTNSLLDFENKNSYTLTVFATSSSGNSTSVNITININDIEDISPIITAFNQSINENSVIGTSLGLITTNVGDSDISSFTLSGNGSGDFNVLNTGEVKVAANLDYEIKSSYNLTAVATNNNGTSNSVDINITINDVADEIPVLSNFSSNINENIASGTTVGTIGTNSGDSAITSYVLSGTNSSDFNVSKSGMIKVVNAIDYETTPTYNFTATATSNSGSSLAVTVVISVNDLYDVAPVLNNTSLNVTEDASLGYVVGTINTNIGDSNITSYTLSGTNNDDFNVSKSGEIKVVNPLDYETFPNYNLTAIASNNSGASSGVSVTIAIGDINETIPGSPTDINITSNSVDENSVIGTVIGTFDTEDNGSTFIYSLVSGPNDDNNNLFLIDSSDLKINVNTNYETTSSYKIRVQSKDEDNSTFSKAFIIQINDANDLTTFTTTPVLSIKQNETYSYIANIADEDVGDKLTKLTITSPFSYSTSGGGLLDFTITIFPKTLDDSDVGIHQFDFNVTEETGDANLTVSQVFDVNVTDVNDKPESNVSTSDNHVVLVTNGFDLDEVFSIKDGDLYDSQIVTLTAISSNPSIVDASVTAFITNEDNATVTLSGLHYVGESNITITMTDTGGTDNGGINSNSFTFLAKIRPNGLGLYEEQKASNYTVNNILFDDINYTWNSQNMWYETSSTVLMPIKILSNNLYKGTNLQEINNGGHYYMNKNEYISEGQHVDSFNEATEYKTASADTNITVNIDDFTHDSEHNLFVSRLVTDENSSSPLFGGYSTFFSGADNNFTKILQTDSNTSYSLAPGFVGSYIDSHNDGNETTNICANRYGKGWRLPTTYEIGKKDNSASADGFAVDYYIPAYLGNDGTLAYNLSIRTSTALNGDNNDAGFGGGYNVWSQQTDTGKWRYLGEDYTHGTYRYGARCVYAPL